MVEEFIKTPSTPDSSFGPNIICNNGQIKVKLNGNYLKQDSIFLIYRNMVKLYFVYKLDACSTDLNTDLRIGSCLFGALKLTKNVDPEICRYSYYGIVSGIRFHGQMGNGVNILLFFGLIIVLPCILITQKKIF